MNRLDSEVALRGLLPSREKAKAAICAGLVLVNGREERRPSRMVGDGDALSLLEGAEPFYVGRGSFKLLKALDFFGIPIGGMRCLDVGASTGGFTQVLLERGASLVYAIDVGTGQLAQALRHDRRVISLERTDFRTLSREQAGAFDFACVDVSFISLKLILPNLYSLLKEESGAVCLVKPQFEAGPHRVKKGVVKEPRIQAEVIAELFSAAREMGFHICGITHSPICGGEGNIEYLMNIRKGICNAEVQVQPAEIVRLAWEDLKG